jgi:integrase
MAAKRDFTDRFLKALKPAVPGKRYITYDAQIPGFGIRVTDRCAEEIKGSFVLVTRFPGSTNPAPRRIGDYPAMSLTKAREIARAWREDIRQGIDPKIKEASLRREQERQRANTFTAVFATFADDHLSTLRTGRDVVKAVENHVFPPWGDRPISEIRRADVNELVRALRKDAPVQANRLLAYLKTFFSWAVDQEMLEASPAASVKRPTKENKRDRVLSEGEIRAIWHACGELGAFGRAIRLMLLTGQRRNEIGRMTWVEIDVKQKIWTLARERTKADRAHEVPLSDLALSVIAECPKLGGFVFTTGRNEPAKKDTEAKLKPISGWSKAKKRLDQLALQKVQAVESEQGAQHALADWHLHDLRRTCATYLAKLGTDRIVISKILNHAEGGVTGVYERHRYDDEKRRALDAWAARLTGIIEGTETGNVVSLAMARG